MDYESVLSPEMSHEMAYKMIKNEGQLCFGCGDAITERFILQVNDHTWHVNCLRCCVCQVSLDRQRTCFIKEDNIYCRTDYAREFGTKCTKCSRSISSNDWVRRAKDHVFHLACFACDNCKRQLSTGEEFALHDSKVLCKAHYVECVDGGLTDDECSHKSKAKRIRTTFSDEQVQVLQANFNIDSNPDGQDLERIAQVTGLSKRVTQVWFQNSRARQKKHQQMQNNNNNNLSPGSVITSIKLSPSNWESCSDSQNSDSLPFSD